MKINYWWSSDKKWFCVLLDDGSGQMTISLPPDEASLLSMNAYPPKDEPSSDPSADRREIVAMVKQMRRVMLSARAQGVPMGIWERDIKTIDAVLAALDGGR